MLKTYLEIISQEKYKEFEKENQKYLTSEKYKQRLKELLKRFFTNEDGQIVNTIIIPYISPNEYSITSIDKEIIDYLNNHGYKCTEESYLLGYCVNNKNKKMPIINVLKMINQYNIEKLKKQKQENLQYSTHYDNRIKAKQNFKENYLTYYQNFTKNRSKVIVFTWLPRAIASMSTSVGWRSCMNLYDGENHNCVFPTIEAGAFIAWLVQEGDEEILNNPQARILIKVYVSENGNIFWYPSENIYGTAPRDFHTKVKKYVLKKQEINLTIEDLENIDLYAFDQSQYLDKNDISNISLKSLFREKYAQLLENQNYFTIDQLIYAINDNFNINLIKKMFLFIKDTLQEKQCIGILEFAYTIHRIDVINMMLVALLDDNIIDNIIILRYAIKVNNKEIIEKIINKNITTNTNVDSEEAYNTLYTAMQYGYKTIVNLILKNPHINLINLSTYANKVIQAAAKYGYTEIVKSLIQDKKVDPSDDNNYTIQAAAENGHTEIVKLLLQDPRVDPSANRNYAIRYAAKNGHTEVVKVLLQDPRVDPSEYYNDALNNAIKSGHIEIVKILLQDKRINLNRDNSNITIQIAAANGHIEIIKLLLKDPRIDPSDDNNMTIKTAIYHNHKEIVKLLLQDPRVRSTITINYLIKYAQQRSNMEIIKFLQQYQ